MQRRTIRAKQGDSSLSDENGCGRKDGGRSAGQTARLVYIILFLILSVIPSAGLLIRGAAEPAENAEQAAFPALRSGDGRLNISFLQQAGEWFQEHFAWRREFVTANAKIEAALFRTSAEDSVILGTDGWLYYRDSLADYQGTDLLSDRALYDIAHTARMTQDYCSLLGSDYLFAIAPDKASLYPEHMPYYFRPKAADASNRTRLAAFMEAEEVTWLDLGTVLGRAEEEGDSRALPELYHRRDSHWTAEGAAIAADAVLDELGIPHRDYSTAEYTLQKDFHGDLEGMLYPAAVVPEEEVSYEPAPAYGYVEEVESTFDFFIHTVSGGAGESLVVYRDSFGNAILPFLAEAYGQAYFTRGTPYTLTDLYECGATATVFLRAERFLPEIASKAPVMEAFPSGMDPEDEGLTAVKAVLSAAPEEANPYYCRIDGTLEIEPAPGERIFADPGDGNLYEAMPVHRPDGTEGFTLYLPQETADGMSAAGEWTILLLAAAGEEQLHKAEGF